MKQILKSMWCKFLKDIYFEYFVFFFFELAGSNLAQTLLNPPKVIWLDYICKVCLQVQTMAAIRTESFPFNHSINAVLTSFSSTRQMIQVKFQSNNSQLMIETVSECHQNWKSAKIVCFHKIVLHLHYQTLLNMLWLYENDSVLNATSFGIYKDNRHN